MKTKYLTTLVALITAAVCTAASTASAGTPVPPPVSGLNNIAATPASQVQAKGLYGLYKTSQKAVFFNNMPSYALQPLLPSGVLMYGALVPGPDLNSPNFEDWADALASAQVNAGVPFGEGGGWPRHDMMFTASDAWQDPSVTNNSRWAVIWIISETPTNFFNLTNLTCGTFSSDVQAGYPNGTLYSTDNFGGTNNYVFNSHWIGGVWNTNGSQLGMTLYESPSTGPMGYTPVNMACLICKQIPYYAAPASSNQVAGYIGSWNSNTNLGMSVTFCAYLQCPGGVVQRAQLTLQTLGTPAAPIINQTRWQAPVSLGVGLTYQPDHTITLQYSPTLVPANWSDIVPLNGGDGFNWAMNCKLGTYTNGFWRYYVQQ